MARVKSITGSLYNSSGRTLFFWLLFILFFPAFTHGSNDFVWSGFATLGFGKVSEEHVTLGDYTDEWSANTDTRIGLLGLYDFGEGFSVTGQVVSKGHTYDSKSEYQPYISWLFATYDFTPTAQVRIGRMRTPHYLYSESLEVGYSYTWVRPPVDVYTPLFSPIENFDGIDFTNNFDIEISESMEEAELSIQFFVGSFENNFTDFEIDSNAMFGVNANIQWSDYLARYSFFAAKTDVSNPRFTPVIQGYNQVAALLESQQQPEAAALFSDAASYWWLEDGNFYYHELGLQWSEEDWTITGEAYVITGPGDGFSTDAKGWYLSVSHRFGQLTPYGVLGWYVSETNPNLYRAIDRTYEAVPAGIDPGIDTLREESTSLAGRFDVKEQTTTLGVRYDLMPNIALKGEWQYFKFSRDSTGHMFFEFLGPLPKNASMVSFALDVVF